MACAAGRGLDLDTCAFATGDRGMQARSPTGVRDRRPRSCPVCRGTIASAACSFLSLQLGRLSGFSSGPYVHRGNS
jgi:hypothetical protein